MCLRILRILSLILIVAGVSSCGSYDAQPEMPASLIYDVIQSYLTRKNRGVTISRTEGEGSISEDGRVGTYTIVLNSQPEESILIQAETDSQVLFNYSYSSIFLRFTEENWNERKTITVAAVNDTLNEGTHRGVISHEVIQGSDAYMSMDLDEISFQIDDND